MVNILSVFSFLSILLFINLGIYAIRKDPRSALNRVFSVLCLCFIFWSLSYMAVYSITDKNELWAWVKVGTIGWSPFAGIFLHFILILTRRKRLLSRRWIYALLYAPGIAFMAKELTGVLTVSDFIRVPLGWKEVKPTDLWWYYAFLVIQLSYILFGLALTLWWGRRTAVKREKKQALTIVVSGSITLFLSVVTDVIFPSLNAIALPSVSPVIILVWAVGTWLTIVRHRFLTLTAAVAADEIISKMMDMLMLLDARGRIIRVNPALCAMTGYHEHELRGSPVETVILEQYIFKEEFTRVRENGIPGFSFEGNFKTRMGAIVPAMISASLMRDENGDFIGLVVTGYDLTEAKQLERERELRFKSDAALQESRERFRLITENMLDYVAMIDANGIFRYVSPSHARLGYRHEELLGIRADQIIHPDDKASLNAMIERGFLNSDVADFAELRVRLADGTYHWIECVRSAVYGPGGKISTIILSSRDIDERKNMQIELKASEEQLRERNMLFEKELTHAKFIHAALLPSSPPECDRLWIQFRYFPLEAVGGDYFSFTALKEGGFGVFIGDVAGHGVSSALFISLLKATADRVRRSYGQSPEEFIKSLNSELMEGMPAYFLTALYGYFDLSAAHDSVRFTFAKGGHMPPVLLRADGRAEVLSSRGTIIGQFENAVYKEKSVDCKPGDRIYLYTDGLPESRNESGQIFGFDELANIMRTARQRDLSLSMDAIMDAVNSFRDGFPLEDDIVLIGIEVR